MSVLECFNIITHILPSPPLPSPYPLPSPVSSVLCLSVTSFLDIVQNNLPLLATRDVIRAGQSGYLDLRFGTLHTITINTMRYAKIVGALFQRGIFSVTTIFTNFPLLSYCSFFPFLKYLSPQYFVPLALIAIFAYLSFWVTTPKYSLLHISFPLSLSVSLCVSPPSLLLSLLPPSLFLSYLPLLTSCFQYVGITCKQKLLMLSSPRPATIIIIIIVIITKALLPD